MANLGVPVVEVVAALRRAVGPAGGDLNAVVGAGGHVVYGRGGDNNAFVLGVVEAASGVLLVGARGARREERERRWSGLLFGFCM